jgi:hypothetical protein
MELSSILILLLLESCLQTCMTHTIAECTLNDSWWWTEELSETCRVTFQNEFEKLVHLVGFIIRKFTGQLRERYLFKSQKPYPRRIKSFSFERVKAIILGLYAGRSCECHNKWNIKPPKMLWNFVINVKFANVAALCIRQSGASRFVHPFLNLLSYVMKWSPFQEADSRPTR